MSKELPLPSLAASAVKKLFKLPDFESLRGYLSSEAFPSTALAYVKEKSDYSGDIQDIQDIHEIYGKTIESYLDVLPLNSWLYTYFALQQDYTSLRPLVIDTSLTVDENLFFSALRKNTILSEIYISPFRDAWSELSEAESIFEKITILEKIYLHLLIEKVAMKANEYVKVLIRRKLDTYNFMTIIRRMEYGDNVAKILDSLVWRTDFYSPSIFQNLQFGDVVGDVGKILNMKPEDVSVEHIEKYLREAEIKHINQAMYYGVDAPRLLQYTETLYCFLINIKLAYIHSSYGVPTNAIEARMINYSIT
jgi:hypothetical protein